MSRRASGLSPAGRSIGLGLLLTAAIGGGTTVESQARPPAPATLPQIAPSTGPTTGPATAIVDPAAVGLLDRVAAAYLAPGPRHVAGTLVGHFDVAGREKTYRLRVDGRTDGEGRFLHDAGEAGLIVGDGETAYLYDRRRDSFAKLAATPGRPPAGEVSGALVAVLLDENPALLLSLTADPAGLLRRAAKTIRPAATPTTAPATASATAAATMPTRSPSTGPASAAGLVLGLSDKTITLRLDAGGAIVASDIDYTPLMTARGAKAVRAAGVMLVYDVATREPPPAGAFAWRPPATATEFDAGDEVLRSTTQP